MQHFDHVKRGEYFQKFQNDRSGEFCSPYLGQSASPHLYNFGNRLFKAKNRKMIFGKRTSEDREINTVDEPISIYHIVLPMAAYKISTMSYYLNDELKKIKVSYGYDEWTMVKLVYGEEISYVFVPLHFHYGLYFQFLEKMMLNKDLFKILLNRLFYVHIAPCYMSIMYNIYKPLWEGSYGDSGWDFHFFHSMNEESNLMKFYKNFF